MVALIGRAGERRTLERVLEDARGGESRVLALRGEPGIGKTALLEHAVASASGFRVVRATGIESEMELAFAGLHQLCLPIVGHLAALPEPQRDALGTAFGLSTGRAPDRFLIGLAVLSLLSEAAEQAPLLCVVDDAHWLDRASAHVLSFVGRRLCAERVCVLFGTRRLTKDLSGFPELVVDGLGYSDANALLATVLRSSLDNRVRERIIAETRGNPLALLEWPKGLTPAELAGGFGSPTLLAVSGQIVEKFRRRLGELPSASQRFLTVAAAEPTGDAGLVWRAAARLGVSGEDVAPAVEAGLVEVGARVRFRHPTVRSAAYGAAAIDDRRSAHRALAEATDLRADPDRRAWHLALAATGPDEEVATELERTADLACSRGGFAGAAALLDRSAALTLDPQARARRTIAAARAHLQAGAFEEAMALLAAAEAAPLDDLSRALVEQLRGYYAHYWGDSREAATNLMLSAAKRLENIQVELARETYLYALSSAITVSDLAQEATVDATARAVRAAPAPSGPPGPPDLLLDGMAIFAIEGYAAAAPTLRRALDEFRHAFLTPEEAVRSIGYYCGAATLLWDLETYEWLAQKHVRLARDVGALYMLTQALNRLAIGNIYAGDLPAAATQIGEARSLVEATESTFVLYGGARLASFRGDQADGIALIASTVDQARAYGQGMAVKTATSAMATLNNGVGRFAAALEAAAAAHRPPLDWASHLMLHELVEAAARSGQRSVAAAACEQLSESAEASGSDWGLGIQARCRALLSTGDAAEALYLEAVERLDRSPVRPEAGRAHLLYGEWLRREKRRLDARHQLRAAYNQLSAIGMAAFAERAARELAATGETVRRRSVEAPHDLTPQELQIARLVVEHHTNAEIGAKLFLSARTVEWHLRKVFTKLDVTSRKELRESMLRAG
jgi:DNA-binding CsgD family transcriptional regulator